MIIVCTCGKKIGDDGIQDGLKSHGVCPECFKKQLAAIQAAHEARKRGNKDGEIFS